MGHRMPPRTTPQSHSAALRRESQIEPWLAHRHRQACAASATERRRSAGMKTTTALPISAARHDQRGWMSENYSRLQRREDCFLLTSPFIEPAVLIFPDRRHRITYSQLFQCEAAAN